MSKTEDQRVVQLASESVVDESEKNTVNKAEGISVPDVRRVVLSGGDADLQEKPPTSGERSRSCSEDGLKVTIKSADDDTTTTRIITDVSGTAKQGQQKRRDASEMSGTPPTQGAAKVRIVKPGDGAAETVPSFSPDELDSNRRWSTENGGNSGRAQGCMEHVLKQAANILETHSNRSRKVHPDFKVTIENKTQQERVRYDAANETGDTEMDTDARDNKNWGRPFNPKSFEPQQPQRLSQPPDFYPTFPQDNRARMRGGTRPHIRFEHRQQEPPRRVELRAMPSHANQQRFQPPRGQPRGHHPPGLRSSGPPTHSFIVGDTPRSNGPPRSNFPPGDQTQSGAPRPDFSRGDQTLSGAPPRSNHPHEDCTRSGAQSRPDFPHRDQTRSGASPRPNFPHGDHTRLDDPPRSNFPHGDHTRSGAPTRPNFPHGDHTRSGAPPRSNFPHGNHIRSGAPPRPNFPHGDHIRSGAPPRLNFPQEDPSRSGFQPRQHLNPRDPRPRVSRNGPPHQSFTSGVPPPPAPPNSLANNPPPSPQMLSSPALPPPPPPTFLEKPMTSSEGYPQVVSQSGSRHSSAPSSPCRQFGSLPPSPDVQSLLPPPPPPPGLVSQGQSLQSSPMSNFSNTSSPSVRMDYEYIDADISDTCRSYSPEISDVDCAQFNNLSQDDSRVSLTSQLKSQQLTTTSSRDYGYQSVKRTTSTEHQWNKKTDVDLGEKVKQGDNKSQAATEPRSVVKTEPDSTTTDSKVPSEESMDSSPDASPKKSAKQKSSVDVKDIVSHSKKKRQQLVESFLKVEGPMLKPEGYDDGPTQKPKVSDNSNTKETSTTKGSKTESSISAKQPQFSKYREKATEQSPDIAASDTSPTKQIVSTEYGSDSGSGNDSHDDGYEAPEKPAAAAASAQAPAPKSQLYVPPWKREKQQADEPPKNWSSNEASSGRGSNDGYRRTPEYRAEFPDLGRFSRATGDSPSGGSRPFASKYNKNDNTNSSGYSDQRAPRPDNRNYSDKRAPPDNSWNYSDQRTPPDNSRNSSDERAPFDKSRNFPDQRAPPDNNSNYSRELSPFDNQQEGPQPNRPFQSKYKSSSGIKFHVKSSSAMLEAKTPFLQQMRSSRSRDGDDVAKPPQQWHGNEDSKRNRDDVNRRERLSEHKSQRWAGPKSTRRSAGALPLPWSDKEFKYESPDSPSNPSDNDDSSSSPSKTPFARSYDMSRYKRNNTGGDGKRPFERKTLKNAHPEPTWPATTYCNGELSLDNCVIAGDSITRALKEAAATRQIHVVAAPGCTAYAPQLDKWNERFWMPLFERLSRRPLVKLLVLHIGTNDVGSKLENTADYVVVCLNRLIHKVRQSNPNTKMIFSSILPRQNNQTNQEVTDNVPQINDIINEVNDKIEERSRRENFLGYIDNHDTFKHHPGSYYKDGLHLSDNGSKQLAINIRRRIDEELEKMAPLHKSESPNKVTSPEHHDDMEEEDDGSEPSPWVLK